MLYQPRLSSGLSDSSPESPESPPKRHSVSAITVMHSSSLHHIMLPKYPCCVPLPFAHTEGWYCLEMHSCCSHISRAGVVENVENWKTSTVSTNSVAIRRVGTTNFTVRLGVTVVTRGQLPVSGFGHFRSRKTAIDRDLMLIKKDLQKSRMQRCTGSGMPTQERRQRISVHVSATADSIAGCPGPTNMLRDMQRARLWWPQKQCVVLHLQIIRIWLHY